MGMLRLIVAGLLALSLIAFPAIAAEKKAASGGYGMMDTHMMEHQKMMQDMMGMMKEVMGILKDMTHQPSAEQKKKLEDMMKRVDDLMKKHDEMMKKKMEKKMDKGGGY
ncbi:MAG: hypothetical protein AABY78_00440 [Nitrospirota bacterium]|jgi:hypothetical protein